MADPFTEKDLERARNAIFGTAPQDTAPEETGEVEKERELTSFERFMLDVRGVPFDPIPSQLAELGAVGTRRTVGPPPQLAEVPLGADAAFGDPFAPPTIEDVSFGWSVAKGFGKSILRALGIIKDDEAPALPTFGREGGAGLEEGIIGVRSDRTISSADFTKVMDAVEARVSFLEKPIPFGEALGGAVHEMILPPIDPYDPLTALFFGAPPAAIALGPPRAAVAELKSLGAMFSRATGLSRLASPLKKTPLPSTLQKLRQLKLNVMADTLETGQTIQGIEAELKATRAQLETMRRLSQAPPAALLENERRMVQRIAALGDEGAKLVRQFDTPETLARFEPVLARTQRMYDGPRRLTLRDRLLRQDVELNVNRLVGFQERWVDKWAFANKVEGQVRKLLKKEGKDLPFDERASTYTTILPSSSIYGNARTTEVVAKMRGITNKIRVMNPKTGVMGPINSDYVNGFLTAMFEMSISRMAKFGGRKLAGSEGFRSREELLNYIKAMRGELGDDAYIAVVKASKVVKDAYGEELMLDVAAHLIDEPLATMLRRQHPWYNPIGYLEDEIAPRIAGSKPTLSVTNNGMRRLSDTGQNLLRERPLEMMERVFTMRHHLRLRNQADRALVKVFQFHPEFKGQITKATGVKPVARITSQNRIYTNKVDEELVFRRTKQDLPGTTSFFEAGKLQTYNIPPELERMIKVVGEHAPGFLENTFNMWNAVPRALFTSANPLFYGPAFVADTIIAMSWSGALPQDIAVSLVRSLRNITKHDPRMTRFLKAGGMPLGMVGKTEGQLLKQAERRGDLLLRNEQDWRRIFTNPIDTIEKVGFALDMAPRDAVFRGALRKGLTEPEAALRARRATVDFQRVGTAMRQVNSLYLYLNAGVQGGLTPLRLIRDTRVARINSLIATQMSTALYMWNRQQPGYFNRPLKERVASIIFEFPSDERDENGEIVPHGISISAFEFGPLFNIPTAIMTFLDEKAHAEFGELAKAWAQAFNPLGAATGEGFLPTVPTILGKKFIDLAQNKNSFTGRPIVPEHLRNQPAAEQFDAFTSETAKRVGKVTNISPMKLDFMLKMGVLTEVILSIDMLLDRTDEPAHVLEVAAHLKDMTDTLPDDIMRLERIKLLNNSGLTPSERELANDISRREDRIPFLSALRRRFANKRGGQIYWTGWERAAEALGVDPDQTKEASAKMAGHSRTAEQAQYVLDYDHTITPEEWKNGRKDIGNFWKLIFQEIAQVFPLAVQADPEKMGQFSTAIATIAGAIDDPRSRGEILYSGWKAIHPPKMKDSAKDDMPAFFGLRDQYQASLTSKDRGLLREHILARMTPIEAKYEHDLELMKKYWGVWDKEFAKKPRAFEKLKELEKAEREGRSDRLIRKLRDNQSLKDVKADILKIHLEMRDENPRLDATLRFWGYVPATRPDNYEAATLWERMMREWRTR